MLIHTIVLASSLVSGLSPAVTPTTGPHSQDTAQKPAAQVEPDDASLERIQKKLMQDPAIKLDKQAGEAGQGRATFRVRIDAPALTTEQILGPDFKSGPVPATGMTHQQFLDLVTPKDVRGYAAFTNKEGITVAITSAALQLALKQALEQWRNAKDERSREAARKEVDDAIAALRRARRDAALPEK
jgi:hypothetical protein